MNDIAAFLSHQQLLTGMVGATAAGGLLFQLRAIPGQIKALVQEAFTVTLVIDSDSEAYAYVNVWLARHRAAQSARRLMLQSGFDYERGCWDLEFTLGAGWHVVRIGARPVFIHRHVEQPQGVDRLISSARREQITLISLGRDQSPLRSLIPEAKGVYEGAGRLEVYFWHNGMYVLANRPKVRGLDTVFAPVAQVSRLIGDVERFLAAREAYAARGIPWRRGYLLKGPPGTGKTTLAQAVAGHVRRPLYSINLATLASDNELLMAFNELPVESVVVIEDIDAARITRSRSLPPAQASPILQPSLTVSTATSGVTLSGLLNAIDGVAARDGRLLFITSNHAEELDPALLRAGRIDLVETVDRLGETDARRMWRAFRPEGDEAEFQVLVAPRLPIAPADLQNLLLSSDDGLSGRLGIAA